MKTQLKKLFFFFLLLFTICSALHSPPMSRERGLSSSSSPFKVGVLIDLETKVGRTNHLCMQIALSDFYSENENYSTRLDLSFKDSRGDPVAAASAAVDLLKVERVHAIIGPQTSDEAAFLVDLGSKVKIPIVSFSATSPSISPKKTPFFVRAALNDSFQTNSVAALVEAYQWKNVALIYEQSEFGTGIVPYIVDSITAVGARISSRCVLPPSASDDLILRELYKLMAMESRVFVVHMSPILCSRFFPLVTKADMMSKGFAWILSEGLTNLLSNIKPSVVRKYMSTVIGVKPYVEDTNKPRNFTRRWHQEFHRKTPEYAVSDPSVMGLWAYDTVWMMAMAAEDIGASDPGYSALRTGGHFTDFADIGVSNTGPRLLRAIRGIEFDGLSGRSGLKDGELHLAALKIVNLVQNQERTLGFWTPEKVITRTLNSSREKELSPTAADLSPAIWPGNTRVTPKGWVHPIIGRTLKVLVPEPIDRGFYSLLRVEVNQETNETIVSGFVFEMFEAAIKTLPYALHIEYTAAHLGDSIKEYNDLVQLLVDKKYDALVGDVTITYNRSKLADFSQPYIQSGVSMVVALRDDRRNNPWVFLKPLTWELWLASGIFLLFTGAIVWTLEHQINGDFRGTPDHQMGTVLFFIFSTLVFSQREKMRSNLTKIVVIMWLLVVFVLQSSYTASLTSMLAVKRLEPTVAEIEDLINGGEYVGYLKYSFTKEMLKDMGFKEEMLRAYRSADEYHAALALGSKNGGVSAVIDEIPYLKVFLKDFCTNYSMAGRVHRVAGFGFVFPKGSPLVSDISKGILHVTESDKNEEIERKWFGDQSSCPGAENKLNSDSLNLSNFWGPFFITGAASAVSVVFYLFHFLHKQVLKPNNSTSARPFWRRIASLVKHYDEKDYTSHHFRRQAKDEFATSGLIAGFQGRSRSTTPTTINNGTEEGTPPPELSSPHSIVVHSNCLE